MSLATRITELAISIAGTINLVPRTVMVTGEGRVYCYTNRRWVGPSSTYGQSSQNQTADLGTGALPSAIWEQGGFPMPAGTRLRRFMCEGRANNAQVSGMEFAVVHYSGANDGSWNSDAEVTQTVLLTGTLSTGTFRSLFNSGTVDVTIPADGHVFVAYRPTATPTATRYFYQHFSAEYELPAH